jgi:hypothetical protein
MRRSIAVACTLTLLLAASAPNRAGADELTTSRRMRMTGILLTVLGAAMAIPGAVVLGLAASCKSPDAYSCGEHGAGVFAIAGGVVLGVGGGLIITGVPLWVVGQRRMSGSAQPPIGVSRVSPDVPVAAPLVSLRFE